MSQTSPTSHEPSERVDEAQQVMKDEEERSNEAQYFTSTRSAVCDAPSDRLTRLTRDS